MKLLFDQNLSPLLVECLADLYPDSTHVYLTGLDRVSDLSVWTFAREQGYIIISKDSDFNDLSTLFGFPPKVVWIRLGNCTNQEVEAILRLHYGDVVELVENSNSGILALF